jgi:hypothetical protein
VAHPAFPRCLGLALVGLLGGACLHPPPVRVYPRPWRPGEVLLQGLVGAKYLSDFSVDRGASSVELEEDEYEILPVIGGGAQLKLAGASLDFGVEGLLSFAGRGDLEAFASSGGVAVAAFDVDLLVFEGYGGPFVSWFIGDSLRFHAAGGPLILWAGYDQSDDDIEEDADGAGGGLYARAGLEFLMPSGNLIGFGAKWSEASLDLSDELGDLELGGIEMYVTYAYSAKRPSRREIEGW